MVALRRVVVDDVEDDLEPGGVQGPDHRLELVHLATATSRGAVRPVRSEEADAVVTPVVMQAPLEQVRVLDELVHGHQLDGRHPEVDQIAQYGRDGPAPRRCRASSSGTSGWR